MERVRSRNTRNGNAHVFTNKHMYNVYNQKVRFIFKGVPSVHKPIFIVLFDNVLRSIVIWNNDMHHLRGRQYSANLAQH